MVLIPNTFLPQQIIEKIVENAKKSRHLAEDHSPKNMPKKMGKKSKAGFKC